MTTDWTKEVEKRKENLLADLFDLLRVPSVREDDKATVEAPVGPGPKEALLKFLEIGKRDGFITKNVDNLAGHIEYGEGDETLGIFGHVDVVPVGNGWNTNPFEPVIKDGRIYARGSSDDKGPSMAAYYGMKIIKELGLPVSKRIRFIIGTDEESGWKCMTRYLEVEEKPDFGFSPDAEFPIINGEKGNVTYELKLAGENEGDYQLTFFESGLRPNMVPEEANATITVKDTHEVNKVEDAFVKFLEAHPVSGTIKVEGGTIIKLYIRGKAAHAQEPKAGVNAGTYLALFLDSFDFKADAKIFLSLLANELHDDSRATKLGIAYSDEKMGDLTMNPGVMQFEAKTGEAKDNFIVLNFRFPKGTSPKEITKGIEAHVDTDKVVIDQGRTQEPHYVPVDDPLVKTLLDVYEEYTGDKGSEKVIGGGTFGRLLERGVAYGAMFPDSIDTMHQANEFMALDDLMRSAVIYADAIYRLAK